MDYLQISILGTIAGTLSLLLIYTYLYSLYRESYIGMWIISWIVFFSRISFFDFGVSSWNSSIINSIIYQLLYSSCNFLFIYSSLFFIQRPLRKFWIYATGATASISIIFTILQLPSGYKLAPIAWFACLSLIYIGLSFLKITNDGVGKYIVGISFLLWGISALFSPFLTHRNDFFCWLSLCCGIFRLLIAYGILIVYFERARADLAIRKEDFENLQQANLELNHFCHSIAHDFKAPLLSINQLARHLTVKYSEPLSNKGKEFLSHIQDKSAEVIAITDHLLELSKLSQKIPLREPIPLERLFRQVYKELKELQPERQVSFIIRSLPVIYGDPIMIKIMVSNILSNSLKYTSLREKAIIEVSSVEEEHHYVISVKDNGAGFNMQYSSRLFKIFERLHSVNEFKGTGIGLVICKKILTQHHGQAWLTGKEEEGAVFSFRFPKMIPKQPSSAFSILPNAGRFV